MYKIEKTGYGIKLTFGASMSKDELMAWGVESGKKYFKLFNPVLVS